MAYLITIPIKSTINPHLFCMWDPHPSPAGLMNGAIRHASCPGGEQAAPAGQPGHRARGRKWSRVEEEARAGPACQNSHQAKLGQKELVEIWRSVGRAVKQRGTGCTRKQEASLDASNAVGRMDTLTTWFCSQLAHDFPLLLTTVVPYFTKHYIDLATSEKDTFAFVQCFLR